MRACAPWFDKEKVVSTLWRCRCNVIISMAAWLRRCKPVWTALEISATYRCPTKAVQELQASAAVPSQSNKSFCLRTFGPDRLGRSICASAVQFKGKPDTTASDSTQSTKAELKSRKWSARSVSGWQLFLKEQFKSRQEMKSELKGDCSSAKIQVGPATRDIAAKWKALSDMEKKPYLEAASAKKTPKPKARRLNGYSMFVKVNFESVKARNPTIGAKEVLISMGHEWKSMSDAAKDKYKQRAEKYNAAK